MATVAIDVVMGNMMKVLIRESAALVEIRSEVEWISRELRCVQTFFDDVECRGNAEGESSNVWVRKLKEIAFDVEDAIDKLVVESVPRRRRMGVLFLLDKYNRRKELEQISKRIKEFSQIQQMCTTAEAVTVETPPAAVPGESPIVAPALDKFDRILTQDSVTRDEFHEVSKIAEQVKDELLRLQNIIIASSNSSSELTNERERVWLEEVKDVCNYAADVAESFIARTETSGLPFAGCVLLNQMEAGKFRAQTEDVRSQIGDALRRSLTYGVGGKDIKVGESTSRPVRSMSLLEIGEFPLITNLLSVLFNIFLSKLSQSVFNWWRSPDKNLKSIQRDIDLMHAFFNDIEHGEGLNLNERQNEWVGQLRHLAQHGRSLVAAYRTGGFFRRIKFAQHIDALLDDILIISDWKTIYEVANIQGRSPRNQQCETQITVSEPAIDASVTGLEKTIKSFRGEQRLMDALVRDLQEIEELDGASKVWVAEMSDIARKAKSVLDKYAAKLENKPFHIQLLSLKTQFVIKRKIQQMRDKIKDASSRRKPDGLAWFQTRPLSLSKVQILPRRTQSSLFRTESTIVGFDEDIQVLRAQLLSEEKGRCIISIVGIKGTGKTTLAKMIFKNKVVKYHFDCRVLVSVSPNCTIKQLLQDIAKKAAKKIMGHQQCICTTRKTHDVITTLARKKYLIVIDGIETSQLLDALIKAIPDMSTACRLLLTSCKVNAELHAGTRSFVHPLQLLDDENSWLLFTKNLKKGAIPLPKELEKIGKEIVIKCGGLPSEILTVSRLLLEKDVTEEQWSNVLEQLDEDQKRWPETCNTINRSLPLYLSSCLYYFVLFPAKLGIPARRLIVLWVAEDLVHRGKDKESPEQVAYRYLKELVDLNMVQVAKRKRNGEVKTCRLPHALRGLWLKNAHESSNTATTDSNVGRKSSIIHRVADHLDKDDIWHNHIHGDAITDSATLRTHYKDVLSFMSFDDREGSKPGQEIGNFLDQSISSKCFLQLQVLDLERVYKPMLPRNIAKLYRLRYLGLRWTYLETLPESISKLLKLQTLDLKHTCIHTLPRSVWKMELRHLFLSETYRSRFPSKPIGNYNSLSDLQTLWGLFVDEEIPVKDGLDKLQNITKLGLACQSMSLEQEKMKDQLDAVADWIMKLKSLQSLRLKSRDEEGRPWNLQLGSLVDHINLTDLYLLGSLPGPSILSEFLPSLVDLTLSHSKLEDDPMQILKRFPNLRSLSLLAESYTGEKLVCESKSFSQLHVLKFWLLGNLKEWTIERGALPCLRQLDIRSCPSMKALPSGLKKVSTLLQLKLRNMQMEANTVMDSLPYNCLLI